MDLTTMADRAAIATGTFDFSQQILLKLQNFEGSTGGHLVAPLRLQGKEGAILVDRGWIPMDELPPERWSRFDEAGTVTVSGVIHLTERARGVATPAAPQQEWFRINVAAIARQLPYEIAPVYILQAPPTDGNSALPYREIPEPDLSEGPHLSYAIQWFAFTLMLGGGYIYFVNRQEKRVEVPDAEGQGAAPDE
jgi:surfeit locus 1 family protein